MQIMISIGGDGDDSSPQRVPLAQTLDRFSTINSGLAAALGQPGAAGPSPEDISDRLGVTAADAEGDITVADLTWLRDDASFEAETARALIVGESDPFATALGRSVASRLDTDATWWAATSGSDALVALATGGRGPGARTARWLQPPGTPDRRRTVPEAGRTGSAAGSHDYLMAMQAAGMTAAQLAPAALADPDGLVGDDLVDIVAGADTEVLFGFVTGANQRRPRPGELAKVFSQVHIDDALEAIIARERDNLAALAWSTDIFDVLPGLAEAGFSDGEAWPVYASLAARLGTDQVLWEKALEVGAVWTGPVGALADAIVAGL